MNQPLMVKMIFPTWGSSFQLNDMAAQVTQVPGCRVLTDLETILLQAGRRGVISGITHVQSLESSVASVWCSRKNRTLETNPTTKAGGDGPLSGPQPDPPQLQGFLPSWPDMVIPTGATSGAWSIKSHFEFSPCRRIIARSPVV